MKNTRTIFALAAMAVLASCDSNESVKLTGTIDNLQEGTIILEKIDLDKTTIVDSTKVSGDGCFELSAARVPEPTFFKATIKGTNKTITFIADSTEHIAIMANADAANWLESIEFVNSDESQQLQKIISMASAVQSELQRFVNDTKLDEQTRKIKNDSIVKKIDEYKNYVHGFVFENPRSFVSYYALFQYIMDMPLFDVMDSNDQILFATVATSLNLIYPESDRVKHMCDYVLQAKAIQKRRKLNDALIDSATEVKSPDLNLPALDGTNVKLSSLRGKVVILQFWVSSDKASRDSNRQLQKLYNKYKDKGLEIYQVSFDTSRVLWESASKNDNISWINVCDLQGANSVAARIYNVTQVPANFIIDRDGSLVGKDLFGTRLDNKMESMF